MAKNCGCGGALGNTGSKNCPLATRTRHLIGVPIEAADGTKNKIPAAQEVDQAYLDAMLNESDPTKRWYPIMKLDNTDNPRAESLFDTAASGERFKTETGIKTFTGKKFGANEVYLGKLEEWACTDFGFFTITKTGDLRGKAIDTSGDLYPVMVNKESWDPRFDEPTETVKAGVNLSFDWDSDQCDSEIRMIQAKDITADINGISGLFDILGTFSNITVNGFTLALTLEYGSIKELIPDVGLLLADFAVNEISPTPGSVSLASVTETDPGVSGVYDVVFTAPATSSDVLEVVITKAGRDYTLVKENQITIP